MARRNRLYQARGDRVRLSGLASVGNVFDVEDMEAGAMDVGTWSPTDGGYADSPGLAADGWLDALNTFGQKYLTLKQMNSINAANLERAKRGLPPLDARAYAPQVNVGVNPQTEQTVKYIAWGALALGAVYILTNNARR